jgi:uncharacterized protein (DUF2236 family)
MSSADQDRYFAESGDIAALLDAEPVPRSRDEAERLIREFRPELSSDDRTRTFRDLVLNVPARSIAEMPAQSLLMNAAVDLLPDFAREMHGLKRPRLLPLIRSGTYAMAGTVRWAFAGDRYRKGG